VKSLRVLLAPVALLALAAAFSPAAQGGGKMLKPSKEWKGSVADLELQKLAPAQGVITDAKTFEALWKGWKVGDKMPEINFKKNLVVVATTRGSTLTLVPQLTDAGDLRVLARATRDLRPGFRYQLAVVDREGVKTVNGKDLMEKAEK
jgi:hypothetical protein